MINPSSKFFYTKAVLALSIVTLFLSGCANSIEKRDQTKNTYESVQEEVKFDAAGAGNPIIPGWFADPTIKKFGDIYYIYATTDNEMLASGAPTVWYSEDFENWYNYTMEIPSLESINLRNYWAPDIVKGDDGKYYLFFGNCQAGCNIYGYISDTPIGPWKKLNEDDKAVISHGFPREGFPSLDAQFFRDTDGRVFAYWGTWVHYNGGYAVGELNTKTMKDIIKPANIPLEQTPGPFEAAYVMKKGDKYLLMYSGDSCHDETYNVRYSYADDPYGPFTPGANNPILSTSEDGTVHGPGHHSVLEVGNDYYIVYHRHDYPMTRGGLARQISVDKMIFENDSTLKKVVPTHGKMNKLIQSELPEDLAFEATVTASSYYHLESLNYDYTFSPSNAVDQNNATMWKAATNELPQSLTIDFGKNQIIKRVLTSFEFASYYYQYTLEYSLDGKEWKVFADRSTNRTSGSPMIDDGNAKGRYLKLSISGTEKTGLFAAVWNIKVYGDLFEIPLAGLQNKKSEEAPAPLTSNQELISVDAADLDLGKSINSVVNQGSYGGIFEKEGNVFLVEEDGIKAFHFEKGSLVLDKQVPETLAWNGSYTIATWVKNPEITSEGDCIASWCDRYRLGLANSYNAFFYNSGNYGAGAHLDGHFDMPYKNVPKAKEWHHLVLTFDGVVEKVYVDGKLDNSQVMLLSSQIENAKLILGASGAGEYFSGFIASLRFYDKGLNASEIKILMAETKPKNLK